MDPALVREYRDRWRAVEQVEESEARAATVEDRWRRLNAILQLATALNLDLSAQGEDEMIVWQRWARLKAGRA